MKGKVNKRSREKHEDGLVETKTKSKVSDGIGELGEWQVEEVRKCYAGKSIWEVFEGKLETAIGNES